jgi:RNA polymerase sigma-70 factor (ECF subfamily)
VTGYARAQGVRDPADLTSDVFVAVLTRLADFAGDERSFRSWVFTIAYRRIADQRRASGRAARGPAPVAPAPSAEEVTLERLGAERVEELLAALTPDQRHVLALRVIADLSLEQVADIVGKPVGAVKALQHRALASLRRTVLDEAVSR